MTSETQSRFRSGMLVERAGRFMFSGFVAPGRRSPPRDDEMFVNLSVGETFSRVDFRACWWAPADVAVAEQAAALGKSQTLVTELDRQEQYE